MLCCCTLHVTNQDNFGRLKKWIYVAAILGYSEKSITVLPIPFWKKNYRAEHTIVKLSRNKHGSETDRIKDVQGSTSLVDCFVKLQSRKSRFIHLHIRTAIAYPQRDCEQLLMDYWTMHYILTMTVLKQTHHTKIANHTSNNQLKSQMHRSLTRVSII